MIKYTYTILQGHEMTQLRLSWEAPPPGLWVHTFLDLDCIGERFEQHTHFWGSQTKFHPKLPQVDYYISLFCKHGAWHIDETPIKLVDWSWAR